MKKFDDIKVDLQKLVGLRTSKDFNFSISTVAEALGYKTPTGYWLLENGQRGISINNLFKLSRLYGLTMESFLVPAN